MQNGLISGWNPKGQSGWRKAGWQQEGEEKPWGKAAACLSFTQFSDSLKRKKKYPKKKKKSKKQNPSLVNPREIIARLQRGWERPTFSQLRLAHHPPSLVLLPIPHLQHSHYIVQQKEGPVPLDVSECLLATGMFCAFICFTFFPLRLGNELGSILGVCFAER